MELITSCCGRRPNKSRLHNGGDRDASKHFISASYNPHQEVVTYDLMNINGATEEELMTLRGISRNIARNIVSYRHHIGGFRKAEDLALVSGIGATKLGEFYSEVYCGPYTAAVSRSNRGPSRTSYHKGNAKLPFESKINVNVATVEMLAKVGSIGEDLAEIIVKHRDKNGAFQLLTDIGRIPEIGTYRFESMRNYLSLVERSESDLSSASYLEMNRITSSSDEDTQSPAKSSRDHGTQTEEVFLPLVMTSMQVWARPVLASLPNGADGRTRVRIATWNLKNFSKEKAQNIGVREVVCMTILENRLNILALQELADKEALNLICNELNDPKLAVVRNWTSSHGVWEAVISDACGRMFQGLEYNGFLWDSACKIQLSESAVLKSPSKTNNGNHFARAPFLGYFSADKLDFVMVSVHLKFPGLNKQSKDRLQDEIGQLTLLEEALEHHLSNESDILIVGDFNSSPSRSDFMALSTAGFHHAIDADNFTNISTKNTEGSHCYDNAWFSNSLRKVYTGRSQVVREGLTHPLIPDGWSWGGVVSDHCPVWLDFYTDQDLDAGSPTMTSKLSELRISPQGK